MHGREIVGIEESDILNLDAVNKVSPRTRNPALVTLADNITKRLQRGLVEEAKRIASSIEYDADGCDTIHDIINNLTIGIPPKRPSSPIDILNAVWTVFDLRCAYSRGRFFYMVF